MKKKNLLFILIDCLRSDKLCENKSSMIPTLDRLMNEGVSFSNMIATTSTTTPSVASILTGCYPPAHGVRSLRGHPLSHHCTTLPRLLKKEGYTTYAEVTGPLVPETGLFTDFDHYNYRTKEESVYTQWGENFIKKFKDGEFKEPWLVFFHLWELHAPRKIKKGFNNRKYGKNRYERALSSLDSYLEELLSEVDSDCVIIVHGDHGEKIYDTMIQEYLGSIRFLYYRFRNKIGLTNKEPFKAVGHGYHVYDFLIKVPLIVYNVDITPKKRKIDDYVSQIDILPTMLDILGFSYLKDTFRNQVQGVSLLPLIIGEQFDERPIFVEALGSILDPKNWKVGVRTERYKYVYLPYESGREELYDLRNDPGEENNIIKQHREIASKYRKLIEKEYLSIDKEIEKQKLKEKIKKLKILGKI